MAEFYAVENTVREGVYPGRIVSEHGSHWEAVEEMKTLNEESSDEVCFANVARWLAFAAVVYLALAIIALVFFTWRLMHG